jgi:high affinity sulfate transporter 1
MFQPSLPGLARLRGYRTNDFKADAVAAVVVTALVVPTGMAYAELAGLPAATGIYATVVALLAYALVGPSPVLVVGPDSSLAPIIGASVLPLAGGDEHRAVALAGLLAVLAGAALLLGGILRLGFVMSFLSKPIRLGYLNGVAITIIASQLPKLFGFSAPSGGLARGIQGFVTGVGDGRLVGPAAAIGIGALAAILALRRLAPRVPGFLTAMVGATIAVWALDLRHVPVVGSMPGHLPTPALGGVGWHDVAELLLPAVGLALVAFADTGMLSRALAIRDHQEPHDNTEMAALGFTNLACGALGGFPVAGSGSRTPVAIETGARTQGMGIVAALLVGLLAVAAPGATTYLPSSALAAVVIVAAISLADVPGVVGLLRARPDEFLLGLVAFAGVAVLGVLWGIGSALALSLVAFVVRCGRPHMAELGRVDHLKGYHDLMRHPDGRRIPGLLLARFDAPLFFANANVFTAFIRRLVKEAPNGPRWVTIAAAPITDVDTTAADELVRLDDDLADQGLHLVFAELKDPVRDRLAGYGLSQRFGPDRFYPTVGSAVSAYVSKNGIPWIDWTDQLHSGGKSAPVTPEGR